MRFSTAALHAFALTSAIHLARPEPFLRSDGKEFDFGFRANPDPDPTIRETDVVHVVNNVVVSASGTGSEVQLHGWSTMPLATAASAPTYVGHDVVLHTLKSRDHEGHTDPIGYVQLLLCGMIEGEALWLRSFHVGPMGELTLLDTKEFGRDMQAVLAYDIEHRATESKFIVSTPVLTPEGMRMVSWDVNRLTGLITNKSESDIWSEQVHADTPVQAEYIRGEDLVKDYFVVTTRTLDDYVRYDFWTINNDGDIFSHGMQITSKDMSGGYDKREDVFESTTHSLTAAGMISVIERPGGELQLITYDNRLECNGDCNILPHYIASDDEVIIAPSIVGKSGIVYDALYGTNLFSQCSAVIQGIASATKAMTLIVALDEVAAGTIFLNDDVKISGNAADFGGSQTGFEEGETHSMETLLWSLMVDSGNDAAVAIAEHIAGNEANFANMMQLRANALGMSDSFYCRPAGGCFSTAMDQAILWASVHDNELFQQFAGSSNTSGCGTDKDGQEKCYLFNRDTWTTGAQSWKSGSLGFFCPAIPQTIGLPLSAGYDGTDYWNGSLAGQARRMSRDLVAATLQPQPLDADVRGDARKLWNYGYKSLYTPDKTGQSIGIPAIDFGIDHVSETVGVTTSVDTNNDMVMCLWDIDIPWGVAIPANCESPVFANLADTGFEPRKTEVDVTMPSTAQADGNFLVGQRRTDKLYVSTWILGARGVQDFREPLCCGDGVRDFDEECDGDDFGGTSCASLGYEMGSLTCTDLCTVDSTGCTTSGYSPDAPGSYFDCGYVTDKEECGDLPCTHCGGSPSGCDADGDCLGGPCLRTDPDANPLDINSGYHPDGNFVDEEGNLYYCPDYDDEERVCIDVNGWGVCHRCADIGVEFSSRLGCQCISDEQCEGNEPGLGCYGESSGGGPGLCYSAVEGVPYWQCEEAYCGMAPYYNEEDNEDSQDEMYCHHYDGNTAAVSGGGCQVFNNCNNILADLCTISGGICTLGANEGECNTDPDEDICCVPICSIDSDCAETFGWPNGYVCSPGGNCIPPP